MLNRTLRDLLWLGSILAVAAFVFVVVRRLFHAQAADPLETSILEHATRFASLEPLYLEPTAKAPALMPGYPIAVSILVQLFTAQLWEPRLISLVAALATAGLAAMIVRLETLNWTVAVSSCGFVLAGFGLLVGQPEVARPEIVMMALSLGAFFALRTIRGMTGAVAAAILLTAACLVHAQAVWFVAAAIFYLAYEERPRLITFTACAIVLGGGSYLALSMILGPWFNYNAWDGVVQSLKFNPGELVRYAGDQLLGRLGVLTMAVVLSCSMPTAPWLGPGGMWWSMGFATVGAGLIATQSSFAGPQVLVPIVVLLALLGPISMQKITRHLSAWPGSTRLGGEGVVLAGLSLQFFMFFSRLSTHF